MATFRTTCNRDCPDACGIVATVEGGRVTALKGDPEHPFTRGFLCHRTGSFLSRQYAPDRLLKPLLRVRGRQVEVPWDEALDLAAERLLAIRRESGPAAILHYRSGGSLGLLKPLSDAFFARFGPVSVQAGDICSGAGIAAQEADFGVSESHQVDDLVHARHVINWGKNLFVSNVHLIPVLREARARGARVTLVDPVRTRSAALADRHLAVRPGGDAALALAVGRRLFETGRVAPDAAARCEGLDAFRALCLSGSEAGLLAACDLARAEVDHLADALADGPTAILVGWGLQRRGNGAATVRLLDALAVVSGNLGRKGGGVSFYYGRRTAFDPAFPGAPPPPRTLREPLLGRDILDAKDPPIRAAWISCANPVAMLPDSATVARAIEGLEFSVVLDAFPTDTTRRATLVLPVATLLEDDDLLGAYGHHGLAVSRPVVAPPEGVKTDLEILQALARRTGLEAEMAGSARDWKRRLMGRLADRGVTLERLEAGPVRNPFAEAVLFADGKVRTASGRAALVASLPPPEPADPAWPLWLLSNSTAEAQSSQWVREPEGPLEAVVHPEAAGGLPDGAVAVLRSATGRLEVRLRHDPAQRRDVVVVPKGGHLDRGQAANVLVAARATDLGLGAAYLDARVRIEPLSR